MQRKAVPAELQKLHANWPAGLEHATNSQNSCFHSVLRHLSLTTFHLSISEADQA